MKEVNGQPREFHGASMVLDISGSPQRRQSNNLSTRLRKQLLAMAFVGA
jgi:hypothetical protein